MDTIDRTNLDTTIVLDANTRLGDDVRHVNYSSPGKPGRAIGCATDPLGCAHALVVDELAGFTSIATNQWTLRTNRRGASATIARFRTLGEYKGEHVVNWRERTTRNDRHDRR
jgi:hypothetical protein